MKRLFVICMVLILLFSVSACKNRQKEEVSNKSKTSSEVDEKKDEALPEETIIQEESTGKSAFNNNAVLDEQSETFGTYDSNYENVFREEQVESSNSEEEQVENPIEEEFEFIEDKEGLKYGKIYR